MITGAHLVLFSRDPDADRAYLRDVLALDYVHASGPDDPWLIYALPPAEVGVHPTDDHPSVSLYLMCDDLPATVTALESRGAVFAGEPQDQGWGVVTALVLPSGGEVGLYQPRHATTT